MHKSITLISVTLVSVMFFTVSLVLAETEIELCQKMINSKKYTEGFLTCQNAAAKGNTFAEIELAGLYLEGLGVKKDVKKAIEIAKSAYAGIRKNAETGDVESQIFLGDRYSTEESSPDSALLSEQLNTLIKKDYFEAAKWYRKAAEQGSIEALNKIEDLYGYKLPGEPFDRAELRNLTLSELRKAAERGVVKALLSLGEEYYSKENYEEALKWLGKAAVKGSDRAQQVIDGTYRTVNGKWIRKQRSSVFSDDTFSHAEQGNSLAQYDLGKSFKYGGGFIAKDIDEAIIWYEKSANNGNSKAAIELAEIYEHGRGVKQDYFKAARWYEHAANNGSATAQLKLGEMYENGQGVYFQSNIEAAKWYRKAAENGDKRAEVNLGIAYDNGRGVPKNYQEAARWYQKAAEQGDFQGQALLGLMYATGNGVQRDKVRGLSWMYHAAIAGVIGEFDAVKFREELEKELTPGEIIKAQELAAQYQIEIDKHKTAKDAVLEAEYDKEMKERRLYDKHTFDFKAYLNKPRESKPLKVSVEVNKHQTNSRALYPKVVLPIIPSKLAFTPNDIAIIIGIEKYRTVPPTEYAAADAGMVRDYLKALGIPERNIEYLADDRATLSDIRKVIETKLPNMVKAGSRVIVYYAGHGAPGAARGESYLVPFDGDPSFLADTAYPLSRLYDRLSRLKAKEVLVILDSCFSGAGGRSVLAKNTRPLVMVKDTPPPASKNMIVLTSSRGSQITTSLSEVGHGAFTYFFLRALQEGSRDIGEVYAYLQPRVTEEAKRQNVDQNPSISPVPDKLKGRFLFVR